MKTSRWLAWFTLTALALASARATAPDPGRVRVIRTPENGAVPDAEVGADGSMHLAFVAGDDVFYARSKDDGATFSAPLRVNTRPATAAPPGRFRGPDLALGQDDTVHVIWYVNAYQRQRPKDEWGVYYSRLVPAAAGFAPERNLNVTPSDNYSVAADARGQVAVFWMAAGLFINRSGDNGQTFGPTEKIDLADSCECCASRAFFAADGTLFCAYRDKAGNQRDMFLLSRPASAGSWTRSRASGTPWMINACPMSGSYLTNTSRGPVMAWETKGMISFARFNPAGQKQGEEIVAAPSDGKYPVVLVASDGLTCISWKNGMELHWRLFGADGHPVGVEGTKPSPNPHRHAGVVARHGEFVLFD